MHTVIVTYHGKGMMYEAEKHSCLMPIMYKSCRDFDLSPKRVTFHCSNDDVCSEEDILEKLIDKSEMDIIELHVEDVTVEDENAHVTSTGSEIEDVLEPISVDVSFDSEGYRSLGSTKWVRPRDTLASLIGEFVLSGSLPFDVDVFINQESILNTQDNSVTSSKTVSPGDLLLIEDIGLSQGDTLRFVTKRSRTFLNSAKKSISISFRGKKEDYRYTLYPGDTLSMLMGEIVLRGHFDYNLDLVNEGKSVFRQYLQDNELLEQTEPEFEPSLDKKILDMMCNVPLGDLDITDGDCLTLIRRTPTSLTEQINVKVTVEPGVETVDRVIRRNDTIADVIGNVVISDDFSWSVDLRHGEESLIDVEDIPGKENIKPVGQRLLIDDIGVKDGDSLTLTLCLGSNDDEEEEEEKVEETHGANGIEPTFNEMELSFIIDDFRKCRQVRRKVSSALSLAETVGELLLNDGLDCTLEIRKGNDVIFIGQSERQSIQLSNVTSSTSLSDVGIVNGDTLRISVKRKSRISAMNPDGVYVPIAFNDSPVTILTVRVTPDLTVSRFAEKLLNCGLIPKLTGLKIGCLYGLSPDSLADDKRGLMSHFSVSSNSVIRVFADLPKAPPAAEVQNDKSLKRPAGDIGPAEYPPVKLTITSHKLHVNDSKQPPGRKYEIYVVVHNANSMNDINKVISLSNELTVTALKKAIEKNLDIPVKDQYMLWQTTCGTEGKPFYIEVWQATQNRCWAREDTGEVLKRVNDNSETRIYHLHDDAPIKMPSNGRPLIRLRSAVEFYHFTPEGQLVSIKDLIPLKDRSAVSWISGLLVRNRHDNKTPHFYMQASMGFVCTLTGGQFTKATVRQSVLSEKKDAVIAYFVALIRNGSMIPSYPFRPTTRVHVWTRPGVSPELTKHEKIVKFDTNYVEKYKNTWMIYRNRTMSDFEVSLSEHFKK